MGNYGLPPVAIREGEGRTVTDVDGNTYLDMIGGIAVSSLGHNHPALVEAVSNQAARLADTSNLFLHEKEIELAEKLLELWGNPGRVFLCNSGTEANEAALKLATSTAPPPEDPHRRYRERLPRPDPRLPRDHRQGGEPDPFDPLGRES